MNDTPLWPCAGRQRVFVYSIRRLIVLSILLQMRIASKACASAIAGRNIIADANRTNVNVKMRILHLAFLSVIAFMEISRLCKCEML